MKIQVTDPATGQLTERDMTQEEIDAYNSLQTGTVTV